VQTASRRITRKAPAPVRRNIMKARPNGKGKIFWNRKRDQLKQDIARVLEELQSREEMAERESTAPPSHPVLLSFI
jgi:hypothetical protein